MIRAAHDRASVDGERIITDIGKTDKKGDVRILIPENHKKRTKEREAIFSLRYTSYEVKKPKTRNGDEELESSLKLNLISLKEEEPPEGQERIEWLLLTNLEINNNEDALTTIDYYRQRWKIERFHYVLKSGCEIEKIQQHSVDRIEMMLLMYSIISIHIMQLTYIARSFPDTPCELIFSESEWKTLYRAAKRTKIAPDKPYSMAETIKYVAKLGGWAGAPSDGPPGLKVIWLGLNALFLLCAYREFF